METRGSDNGENEHAETVIKAKNLTKKYKQMNDEFALQNVPFDIKKGEVILIVGPNGAGKSTIINCLSGIIHQTEGVISISFVIRTPRFVFLRRHSKKRFLFMIKFLNHKAGPPRNENSQLHSTACVDVQGRFLIWKTLSNLENTTSIAVSHELEEAEFVSSRFFI